MIDWEGITRFGVGGLAVGGLLWLLATLGDRYLDIIDRAVQQSLVIQQNQADAFHLMVDLADEERQQVAVGLDLLKERNALQREILALMRPPPAPASARGPH